MTLASSLEVLFVFSPVLVLAVLMVTQGAK